MSIKDLLSAEGRKRRRTDGLIRKLCERYGPSEERWSAADALAEIGTDDAVYGLLRRFLAVSEKISEDLQEKRHVQDLIVQMRDKALPGIRKFIRREADAVLAIDCLREILSGDALVDELMSVLRDVGPHSARPNQITPVLSVLTEMRDPRAIEPAIAYLQSYDDSLRLAAIECLDQIGDPRAKDPLISLANDEDVSPRIRERVVQALDAHRWAPKEKKRKK
ncbi:MAG: HEAT repeat domain-containing protein [Acidobacteriota bacterium]